MKGFFIYIYIKLKFSVKKVSDLYKKINKKRFSKFYLQKKYYNLIFLILF